MTEEKLVENRENDPEFLKKLHKEYSSLSRNSRSRVERLETLLSRRSALKLDETKKSRLVRRLLNAQKEFDERNGIYEHVTDKLRRLGVIE